MEGRFSFNINDSDVVNEALLAVGGFDSGHEVWKSRLTG